MINIESYLNENLPFFTDLNDEDKYKLILNSDIKEFKKGDIINNKDISCTGVVIVVDGELRTFMSSSTGKEITLFKLLERDVCVLTSSCVYNNLTFDVSLESCKDSKVIIISSNIFKQVSDNSIKAQRFLLELTQDKLSQAMWVIEQIVFLNLDTRLAGFLLDSYYNEGNKVINITHDKIASNLGSAREVITRMLKRFQSDNIVKLSRGVVEILDIEKLKDLYNV